MTWMKDKISAKLNKMEKEYFDRLEVLHRIAREFSKSGEINLHTLGAVIDSLDRFDEFASSEEGNPPMICDDCNTRPEWKGQHRCHSPGGEIAPLMVGGRRVVGICDCSVSGQCKPPTREELEAFRKTMNSDST